MHKTSGLRDPAAAFPLPGTRDDAAGPAAGQPGGRGQRPRPGRTGLIELLLAILTGSVGLLGDAIHNLSDVSTSAVRVPRLPAVPAAADRALPLRPGTGRGPGRHRDRGGHLGQRRIRRVREHPQAHRARPHLPRGRGHRRSRDRHSRNQIVARYKLVVGRRINSATLIADARHSWLDALSSAGALAGLTAVALGQPLGRPVAGLAVTAFICHVGYEVTGDVVHRLADGIDPGVITPPKQPPGPYPESSTPTPAPAGPAGPCASRSKAGSTRPARTRGRRPRPPGRRRDCWTAPRSRQPDLDHPRRHLTAPGICGRRRLAARIGWLPVRGEGLLQVRAVVGQA